MVKVVLTEDQKEVFRMGYQFIQNGTRYSFVSSWLVEPLEGDDLLMETADVPKEISEFVLRDFLYRTGYGLIKLNNNESSEM